MNAPSPALVRPLAVVIAVLVLAGVVAAARAGDVVDAQAATRSPSPTRPTVAAGASTSTAAVATTTTSTTAPEVQQAWTTAPYRGLGAWIDVFDYDPAYAEGGAVAMGPDAVDALAARGVRTLFLQGGRDDPRTPGGLVPGEVMGPMLARAHSHGMAVVAWYLPKFRDTELDLDILRRLGAFEWERHRFDGLAVDIEANQTEPDHVVRSQRLVDLSRRLRSELPGQVLGAIVVPPVLLEVVNPGFWPGFPWAELAGSYDVWLPMSYWSFRTVESGYRDPHRYSVENVARLRAHLGAGIAVHLIGGVGDRTADGDYGPFVQAATDTGAIGASFYDARTTTEAGWRVLSRWASPSP